MGSKTPTSKFSESKEFRGERTAHKSPIGSTNNQWGMKKPPRPPLYRGREKMNDNVNLLIRQEDMNELESILQRYIPKLMMK